VAQSSAPRIAVLVDTSTDWGRRLIRGIVSYSRNHGPWNLWAQPSSQEERLRLPPRWSGDGIIARVADHPTARHVTATRVPVVNVSGTELRGVDFFRVTTDLRATGRLAAEHLLQCGLKHFAYGAMPRLSYVQHQYEGFAETLAQAGRSCTSYLPSFQSNNQKPWTAQERELAQWLRSLPRPAGVLTWGTSLGRQLIEICPRIGLHVPEDLAILGGDYDELLCETCIPSMSGIAVPSQQIGYEAAQQLDRLMRGEPAERNEILIEPQGVISRHSTDVLAIEDESLAAAIRYIRDHATAPLEVEDVVREVAISRRRLERGFQKILGRSPADEIRRRRIEQAKYLLTETTMQVPDVAEAAGFGCSTYFAYIFKREVGHSPLKYRNFTRGH
jgi:LacI family transcriptional regulator